MKYIYDSSLFSIYARIAHWVSGAGKQKCNIINSVFCRVGIKFDMNSPGKLCPFEIAIKRYSRFEAEGNNKPPVMCQSTFL
jgi:hypothetical protein